MYVCIEAEHICMSTCKLSCLSMSAMTQKLLTVISRYVQVAPRLGGLVIDKIDQHQSFSTHMHMRGRYKFTYNKHYIHCYIQ